MNTLENMHIELRPLGTLLPYARNARTHSDAQVAQIAASMTEFGWTNPVLVDGHNGIIAGHGRILAARQLGLQQIPVIELSHMSETQKRAYILADNKLALNAGWDEAMLKVELDALREASYDLGITGFSEEEIHAFFASVSDEDVIGTGEEEEHIPAVEERVITIMGDIWLLGRHRIMCGDATSATDVQKLLGDRSPHLMVTDPPYGPTQRARSVCVR